MKLSFFTCTLFFSAITLFSFAQEKKISRSEYINSYKDEAIKEMNRSGVPASITLAQGILESGDGNSELARKAKNHFGIKCHSDWKGPTYIHDDDKKDECFRKYKTVLDSYHDHSEFLKKNRYAFLFDLDITDYKGWAKGLKKAGYATNPKYPDLLIGIIEKNNLSQYDQGGGKEMAQKEEKKEKSKKKERKKPKTTVKTSKRRGQHPTKLHQNNIRYIEVKPGDSFEKIAEEFNMGEWQLHKYNDWNKEDELFESGVLFLQPKRGKAKEEFHTVEEGESMWSISQLHGIKLSKLYRKNRMSEGSQPEIGKKLSLQKTVAK